MKIVELKCSSCGAKMKLSDDKTEAFCPYCKNKILITKELSLEEQVKKEESLSYAREKGEIKAKAHFKLKKIIAIFIVIFILISLFLVVSYTNYMSLEYMEDPFKCIDVKFLGRDGSGKVEINNNGTCDGYSNIKYSISKEDQLNENEKITISVISDVYRFGERNKDYIVSGLSKYLTSLDELTDEIIKKLHDYSYNFLKDSVPGVTFKGKIVKLTPYRLYLYSNGKKENILYDVYKVGIKTKSGKIFEKYVVAYYEDFVLLTNNELFSYSRQYDCGNIIKAGDPNVYSATHKDYVGNIKGFEKIEDFEFFLNKNNDGTFEITKK